MPDDENWIHLAALAAKEQDPAKLLALVEELNAALAKKEQMTPLSLEKLKKTG